MTETKLRELHRSYLKHLINLEDLLNCDKETKRGPELAERVFKELIRLENLIYGNNRQ